MPASVDGGAEGRLGADADEQDSDIVDQIRRSRLSEALFGTEREQRIGRFVVGRTLGRGGMGTVLEAYDETLDRQVALKILHGGANEHRLLREAQALARLSHPNVVQIHEVDRIDGRLFIAMERVVGPTLREWQRTPRPWHECLRVYAQAGRGLAAAHAQGLVHRDFKPANCILDEDGEAKVLDFGLARDASMISGVDLGSSDVLGDQTDDDRPVPRLDDDAGETSSSRTGRSASSSALMRELTATGTVLGTMAYMAPEQLMGRAADARSDQFAFCVALYEALHGIRPFEGHTGLALLYAINEQALSEVPAREGVSPVPGWVLAIVRRGLSVSPNDRFPSMNALMAALERVPQRRRRLRWGAAGLGVLALAVGATVAWPEPSPCEGLARAPMPAWTEGRRAAAREGLLATELPFSGAVWGRVEADLDDYARRWGRVRAEACQAAHQSHTITPRTYDLELACLDVGMRRADALVGQFARADGQTVARAVPAVQALPSPSQCRDAELLHVRAASVPENLAAIDEQVRAVADQAWAQYQAGDSRQGLDTADEALELAAVLPEGSAARAEALLVRGMLHRLGRNSDQARSDLVAAIEQAESVRDISLQQDLLYELVLLEGLERDHSAAQAWLAHARGKLPLTPDRDRRELRVRYADAYVEARAGQGARAEHLLGEVIASYHAAGESESFGLVRALRILGEVYYAQGRLAEAASSYHEALEQAEAAGAYREMASMLHDIGLLTMQQGDHATAHQHLTRAHQLFESIFGEGPAAGLRTRVALARNHVLAGENDKALAQAAMARRDLAQSTGVKPTLRGRVMMMSGAITQQQGRHDEALGFYSLAHEAFSAAPEPDHIELAMIDSNRADCLRDMGRRQEALGGYRRALAVLEERASSSDPAWVYPLLGEGHTLVVLGEPAQALEPLERARRILRAGPPNAEISGSVRWFFGRALVESGREPERGLALVAEGRQAFVDLGHEAAIAEIDQWLTQRELSAKQKGQPQSMPR